MNETTQNSPTSNKSYMFSRKASKKLDYILLKLMVPLRHCLLALASGTHRTCIGLDEKDLEPIELWMDGLVDDGGVSKCFMDTPKRGPSWDLKKLAPKAAKTRPTDWVIQRPEGYYCKLCRDALGSAKGVWVTTPCTNKEMNKAIVKHHKGVQHQAYLNERTGSKSQVRHLEDLNTQEMISITKRMRDVYYMVKKNRPLSDFSDLVHLGTLNGSFADCSGLSFPSERLPRFRLTHTSPRCPARG
jgi:hypothetical protein